LKVGIEYAQMKGVIDVNYVPQPYVAIDVYNKTPEDVADTILQYVQDHPENSDDGSSDSGYVIVLVGLSGTGKGTTVTQLVTKLQQQQYNVITWSNGNIFRCVTLLATTYWEDLQKPKQSDASSDEPFNKDVVLTKDNIEMFMNMISFEKNASTQKYDIKLNGFQFENLWISDIQNTLLKSSTVSKHIPTVAELTQVRMIYFLVSLCTHENFILIHLTLVVCIVQTTVDTRVR
jgi:GTPase SAR1 family protein